MKDSSDSSVNPSSSKRPLSQDGICINIDREVANSREEKRGEEMPGRRGIHGKSLRVAQYGSSVSLDWKRLGSCPTRGSRRVKERINRPLVSLGHCPLFRCLLKQLTGASRCSVVSLALRFHTGQHCSSLCSSLGRLTPAEKS